MSTKQRNPLLLLSQEIEWDLTYQHVQLPLPVCQKIRQRQINYWFHWLLKKLRQPSSDLTKLVPRLLQEVVANQLDHRISVPKLDLLSYKQGFSLKFKSMKFPNRQYAERHASESNLMKVQRERQKELAINCLRDEQARVHQYQLSQTKLRAEPDETLAEMAAKKMIMTTKEF